MKNVQQVKSEALFPIVIELISNDHNARITVTGNSMSPFLKNLRDSVELSKIRFEEIKRGDIVLIQRKDKAYVMHRVYKKKQDSFYIIGDAQQWIEGPLLPEQLVAIVTKVWRNNKEIQCSNILWRLLSQIWLFLRVFRYKFFGIKKRLNKLKRFIGG